MHWKYNRMQHFRCPKSIHLSEPWCNVTFSREAPRIPLALISLSSLDAQHLVRSASALTPTSLYSVLSFILRMPWFLESGSLSYLSWCPKPGAYRYSVVFVPFLVQPQETALERQILESYHRGSDEVGLSDLRNSTEHWCVTGGSILETHIERN